LGFAQSLSADQQTLASAQKQQRNQPIKRPCAAGACSSTHACMLRCGRQLCAAAVRRSHPGLWTAPDACVRLVLTYSCCSWAAAAAAPGLPSTAAVSHLPTANQRPRPQTSSSQAVWMGTSSFGRSRRQASSLSNTTGPTWGLWTVSTYKHTQLLNSLYPCRPTCALPRWGGGAVGTQGHSRGCCLTWV
jgi:hypothetical protein